MKITSFKVGQVLPSLSTTATVAQPRPMAFSHPSADHASALLTRLFRDFKGTIVLRLWNGTTLRLGKACLEESQAGYTLIFHARAVEEDRKSVV